MPTLSHSLWASPGNYFAVFFLSWGPLGIFCSLGTVILCLILHVFILLELSWNRNWSSLEGCWINLKAAEKHFCIRWVYQTKTVCCFIKSGWSLLSQMSLWEEKKKSRSRIFSPRACMLARNADRRFRELAEKPALVSTVTMYFADCCSDFVLISLSRTVYKYPGCVR